MITVQIVMVIYLQKIASTHRRHPLEKHRHTFFLYGSFDFGQTFSMLFLSISQTCVYNALHQKSMFLTTLFGRQKKMTITNPTAFDRKFFRVYNALCFIGLACELVGCVGLLCLYI